MDHKVSKDMISSGMIPSGEKTQADLGRTQYGSAPSPSSLMEAYRSIYEHHQKDADGNVIPHEEEEVKEGKMPEGLKNYLMKKKGKKEDKKDMKEGVGSTLIKGLSKVTKLGQKALVGAGGVGVGVGGGKLMHDSAKDANNKKKVKEGAVDLFDLVKGRLIDEGCDEQEAINIMINLSEEELNEISEGLASMALKTGMAVGGAVLAKKGLDKAKKGFDNFLNKQRNTSPIGGNTRPGADKIEYGK